MNSLTSGKLIGYLAAIFLAGGATGAVITVKNTHHQEAPAPTVEKACTRFQDRLTGRLGLTPEQVAKLQPVFAETGRELHAVRTRAMEDTDAIVTKAYRKIAQELTPEQKAKLDLYDKERRDWLQRRLCPTNR